MTEDPVWLKELLDDLRHKARNWPPDKFLEFVDKLVESSRNHIESNEDERVRESLLELYQGIIRYAFACQIQALSLKDPGYSHAGLSASC
jgi:hypothetical protein